MTREKKNEGLPCFSCEHFHINVLHPDGPEFCRADPNVGGSGKILKSNPLTCFLYKEKRR